jgi:hypothetical protein
MLLRAVRAHRLASAATCLLALVVAAGSVAVVGAARVGATPGAVAAMLALYGGVALAEQTSRTATARRQDVALARLRGLSGARLVGFAAAPLLAVTLTGVVLGSVLGVWLAGRIAGGWGGSYSLGTREVVVGVGLLAGAWATVCVVTAAHLRAPLVEALAPQPRRHEASWVSLFLEILLVAAGALAVYEAHRGDHGWVATIAPALAALAVGQVVMWLLAVTPRVGHRLGAELTTRRLRRDPEPGSALRIVVAAGLLLAVTLTGTTAAAGWRDDAAHLRAGGPTVVPFEVGALRAYAAAHDADPGGRWLMAAVAIDDLNARDRRVFVDAARWPAVVGDFVPGTSVAGATPALAELADQADPVLFRGDTLEARVDHLGKGAAAIKVRYVGDPGYPLTVRVPVTADGTTTHPIRGCRIGCSLLSVSAQGLASFDLTGLRVGDTDLLDGPLHQDFGPNLLLEVNSAETPQQALTTPGLEGHPTVQTVDGNTAAVDVIDQVDAVPFLGRAGSLLDLPRALRGAVGSVAVARAVVVARADTPAPVLARLTAAGGGTPASYDEVVAALDRTPEARADRLALWVAVGIALVALTHLLAWLGGQVGRRRFEVAGLRTAGITPRTVRRAYLVEAGLLAGVVLLAAGIAAVLATRALLTPLRLVGGWAEAPELTVGVRPWILVAVLLAVTAVTALACGIVFTRFGRGARPAALREADR